MDSYENSKALGNVNSVSAKGNDSVSVSSYSSSYAEKMTHIPNLVQTKETDFLSVYGKHLFEY